MYKENLTGTLWEFAVRLLIDGYNLMHAWGRLGTKLSRDGFRRVRRRFLDDLARELGPELSSEATVVFDASAHPGDFPLKAEYRGLSLVFALGEESADARIEALIALDSTPKSLVVVSSDRRIRQAAHRRKARSIKSDDLLDALEKRRRTALAAPDDPSDPDRAQSAGDSNHWLETFGDLDHLLEAQRALTPPPMLTDAEIAALEREIERDG